MKLEFRPKLLDTLPGYGRAAFAGETLHGVTGLHAHTLCEQDAAPFARTLAAIEQRFGDLLPRLAWINFGGGHHITRPGYDLDLLCATLAAFRAHHPNIETVYLDGNVTSHFNPLLDTIRIYRSLLQFCLSSVLSFVLDNALFAGVLWFMAGRDTARREDILVALAIARLVSSNFNYFYNRFVVFERQKSSRRRHRSYYGYFGLVLAIAGASYVLTEGFSAILDAKGFAITVVKIVVETFLFCASYWVQKRFIFKNKNMIK